MTRSWNASTHTFTDTSPEGRVQTTVVDTEGRPTEQQIGNLTPTSFGYTDNRLTSMTRGSGPTARVSTLSYDEDGNVESVTDPAERTVSFTYDAAGRVLTQTLPGDVQVSFLYDTKGNLTSVTPPGKPAHTFQYDAMNRPTFYNPPQTTPPMSNPRTAYEYRLTGEVSRIRRPDGQTLFMDYDIETGVPMGQVLGSRCRGGAPGSEYRICAENAECDGGTCLPTDNRIFFYDDETGNLERIGFAGGELAYTYDGSLPKSESWDGTGAVAGTVSRTYDDSLRVETQSINAGSTVTYTYDDDDLVTAVGPLSITRSPQTGLITETTLGVVTETLGYSGFGELTSQTATVDSTTGLRRHLHPRCARPHRGEERDGPRHHHGVRLRLR